MPSGVYKIENTLTGVLYIGSTVEVSKREREHFSALRCGTHRNQYLQRAFDKYGRSAFNTSILEYCSKPELTAVEQYWINVAQHEEGRLYNLDKTITRTGFIKPKKYWLGKKRSASDIQKFVSSHLGKVGIMRNDNTTGFTGVQHLSQNGSFRAQITINRRTISLGCYRALLSAVIARTLAEELFPGVNRD